MKDDIARELLEPLANEYASTEADRERIRAKLRDRVGAAAFAGSATTASSRLAGRHMLVAIVGVAGIAAVTALGLQSSRSTRAASAVHSQDAELEPSTTSDLRILAAQEPPSERAMLPVVSVDALPSVGATPSSTPVSTRAAIAPRGADTDDGLVRETRLMARANETLRDGEHRVALELFDQHAREFPRGVLADERAVSRIVTLCKLGLKDEASRDAEQFLRTHRPSPLTRRIDSSCAGTRRETPPREADEERSP